MDARLSALDTAARRNMLALACTLLAGGVTLLLGALMVPGIDAPSHLFQTWLYRHGGFDVWNNYWYAGRYEFVNYSMLYYPLAAHVGQLGVLVPCSALMGGCFALVCRREWGAAARGPSVTFAVTAPFIMMIGGTYPFLAGIATSLAALLLLQRARHVLFAVGVLLTLAFSPLSFSLLCAVLAGVVLGQARPLHALRLHRAALAAVIVVFVLGVVLQRAFPSEGWYPYDLADAGIVLVFSLAGLWVAGRHARTRSMRAMFAVYLALNLMAFLLKGPIGSNPSRLFAIAGAPMLWLTANLNPRRSRLIVIPIIALAVGLQVGPKVRDAYSAWENPAAARSYWRPALRFLQDHRAQSEGYRVEAVSTWGHWEAYYVARAGVPLARGWFRQEDFPQNGSLYNDNMSATAFRTWLRSVGVRYVLLPDAPLDYSSMREAALLRSGASGLMVAGRTRHWTFYELPNATPIVTAPRGLHAKLTYLGQERIVVHVSGPGRYVARIRYSPYRHALPTSVCLSPTRNGMTLITTTMPGFVQMDIDTDPASMAIAAASQPQPAAC
ncbi:MAG TPA: hypothetical protein VE824_04195 [Gaiellales bacterium]|nr:hypothetical protein [Gaiellales bacterium]